MKNVVTNSASQSALPDSSSDEDIHADVTAETLAVGDADKGDQRHRLLDPVDIAGKWLR